MRRLATLVIVEALMIVLLGVVCFGGRRAPALDAALPSPPTTAAPDAGPRATAPTAPQPGLERQEAVPRVTEPATSDPVGILVTGRVRATDGTPIAGASVAIRRDRDYYTGDSATPGVYAIAGLRPGEWQITCRAEGYANYEAPCTLDDRAYQQVDLELQTEYVVRVKVQGADGASILDRLQQVSPFGLPYAIATEEPLTGDLPCTENSRVSGIGVGEWSGLERMGRDADPGLRKQGYAGLLRLSKPPPVHAALLLRTTLLQSQRIEAGQHELVFTLEPDDLLARLGRLQLRLLDAVTGQPIAGTTVGISTAQGGGAGGRTGEDGRAAIEHVLPGLSSLELSSKGHEALWRYVLVPAGETVDLGDITLTEATDVSGVVIQADGRPGNGASVQWTELEGRSPQRLVGRRNAAADAEGRFELYRCGRRRYVIFARGRDGSFGYATVDATRGAPDPLQIVLSQPKPVRLRADFGPTVGYVVSALAGDRTPVAVADLGSSSRPTSMQLPVGDYTIEIHDIQTGMLTRSFPLHVGDEPLTIEVP